MAVERVFTGVPGLDELVEGGFPKNSTVLITGGPGTGKTILASQFLYAGALKNEPGLFVSFEQTPDEVRLQAKQFGWDFEKLEAKKLLKIVTIPIDAMAVDVFSLIKNQVEDIDAKRIVVDSLAVMAVNAEIYSIPLDLSIEQTEQKYRALNQNQRAQVTGGREGRKERLIYLFIRKLKTLGATAMVITDAPADDSSLSRDGVSEFACDGVLRLHAFEREDSMFTVNIPKMRVTKHKRGVFSLDITDKGVVVRD